MTWNYGYNVEVGYTYGYYRELNPSWLELCALVSGATPPSILYSGKLRYLELGCGQGLNLCLIAACYPDMEFLGIDFNPQHVAHAQSLAKAAGLGNIKFIEGNFLELGRDWPAELGRFHYVSAHGVLSWISKEVREGLYRCIESALLPGGLVYLSYNTFPGWLSGLVVQHLLRTWQKREGLSSVRAIEVGRERLFNLTREKIALNSQLPLLIKRVEHLVKHDLNYLINEYLHDEWTVFWFDEIASEVQNSKLVYLGTTTAGDWFLPAMLPEEWKVILKQYTDPVERELMFDVLVNQSFRRDLWVKGKVPIWPQDQKEALLSQSFILLEQPEAKEGENPYKFSTSLGEVTGKPEVYGPLYEALSKGKKTLGELIRVPILNPSGNMSQVGSPSQNSRSLGDTLQAVGFMLHAGHIAIAREIRNEKPAKALNRVIMRSVLNGAPYRFVVASTIPWVVSWSDSELMLGAIYQTKPKIESEELGKIWVEHLLGLGRGLVKDGKTLRSPDEMLPWAAEIARGFLTRTLPRWGKLGIL
ncbi:MAG: class I SAM-dependent methyltransferase [Syntrophobacterales bacterium]|nr:class I SAM-dependent methyltransferase [Syntrophobacterales bacterium]